VNLDGQLQEVIDELLAHGISLDLAKKEFEKKYIVGAVKRSSGISGARRARSASTATRSATKSAFSTFVCRARRCAWRRRLQRKSDFRAARAKIILSARARRIPSFSASCPSRRTREFHPERVSAKDPAKNRPASLRAARAKIIPSFSGKRLAQREASTIPRLSWLVESRRRARN